ncbi:hypothetical protein [Pedobacter frigoris]|uniref:hypothetical protein n=1 Tax=Pedobacter frigoris TaxID=2571272 RepID=UPI00292F96EA|nr:hypothetical protein [Pedobacter frigoris]
MDKILLKLVSLLMPLLAKTGVNTDQLYHILKLKLLMDGRRPHVLMSGRRKASVSNGKVGSSLAVSLVTVLMGIFIGLTLLLFNVPMLGQTVYFSAFMVMMSLTLITDFTTVLLDVRDQYILLPRPVNDRTLAVSRIMHISIYVFRLAFLQGLGGLVVIGFTEGLLAVPVFLLQIIQASFLSILLVNVMYLLLMKVVSPQKFKDIISYFQIAFSILIFGAYQLLPRLINSAVLEKFNILHYNWAYFLPPVWIAALSEVVMHPGRATVLTTGMAILGLAAPLLGLWLVAKVFAPGFNKSLAESATSEGTTRIIKGELDQPNTDIVARLSNLFTSGPVENAGFRITWKLAARTREFKIKVYPAFAYVPIFFLYFTLTGSGSVSERLAGIQSGKGYIFLIYLCTFVMSAVLQHISFSEKYKPAWIYYALPITEPGKILSGMYKVVMILYYLPYCVLIGIISILVWGPQVINDVVLATIVGMIYGIVMALFMVKGLPFSKPVLIKQSGGRIVTSLMILVFVGIIGYGQYFLARWEMVIWVCILLALVVYLLMMRYYTRQTWGNIEINEI